MVTVTFAHCPSLHPRKLRIVAAVFVVAAVFALLTGCSSLQNGEAAVGLRGLALAARPSHIESDPAQPQRHARLQQLTSLRLTHIARRQPVGTY